MVKLTVKKNQLFLWYEIFYDNIEYDKITNKRIAYPCLFKLNINNSDKSVNELLEKIKSCEGVKLIEMLGIVTPVFEESEAAQYCIENILNPYILCMKMADE